MNTSSAEITESRASVPYAKSAVANTVLTASARSAADAQANTTAAVSALVVKRQAGCTTVCNGGIQQRLRSSTQRSGGCWHLMSFRQLHTSEWLAVPQPEAKQNDSQPLRERYTTPERGVRGGAYVSASRVQRFNENRLPNAD